jgi:hypothetical protein
MPRPASFRCNISQPFPIYGHVGAVGSGSQVGPATGSRLRP